MQHVEKLRELFPEVVSENGIDFEKLRLTLGDDIAMMNERYVLNWAGKSEAFRAIQTQTTATLKPQRGQSVDFDTTQNVFIEGENLEVLKVLQKSYYGKVKMIYIDPPYNTGNDSFIYPDKFSESKEEYLKRIGDKDEAGYLTKEGFFRKNSKENGQFHSNWLSMMYPRLFLARNLLRDDGVIFVSIDDNEVHNLRLVMNEIFGEENFVASVVWQKKQSPQNDATNFSDMHDYVLVYAKRLKQSKNDTEGWQRGLLGRDDEQTKRYINPDGDPRKEWASMDLTGNKTAEQRPNLFYAITNPKTAKEVWPPRQRAWLYEKTRMKQLLEDDRIWWGEDGNNFPRLKRFLSEVKEGIVPSTWWSREFAGDNQAARREIRALFPEGTVEFDTPKPPQLLKRILEVAVPKDEEDEFIVLDFFAGSGTTGQAIMELNKEDGKQRRFVLVQIPETLAEESEAFRAGYKTIAEICKERLRRVSKKIKEEIESQPDLFKGKQLDLGFKVFTLEPSNFKIWRTDVIETEEELKRQMEAFADPVRQRSETDDMAWEILLKSGFELTTPLEKMEIGGAPVYSIAGGELLLLLEAVTQKAIDQIVGRVSDPSGRDGSPAQRAKHVICLDRLFAGNDQLKTNTVLQMKDAGVEFRTI